VKKQRQLDNNIQTLPQAELDRYAISLPKKVQEFFLKNRGGIPFVTICPTVEQFSLPEDYEEVSRKEEKAIKKKFSLIMWVLFGAGYFACAAILWRTGSHTIWGALLATIFTYTWCALLLNEFLLGKFIDNAERKQIAGTPLKKSIELYERSLYSYLFWEHVDFCYSSEQESLKKSTPEYRYKLNFIKAHQIVSEYVDLFASGEVTAFGFPASDFSFYGLYWKEILFDASKIWAGHAIIYGDRTEKEMQKFGALLISYNLGMSREDYEYNKAQYTIFEHTGGKEGAVPNVERFFENEKYADYEKFVEYMYEYKQRLIDSGITLKDNLKDIPYEVLRQLCVDVYRKTGMVFQGEDIAFFKSLEQMRLDTIVNRQSVYKPYEQYIMSVR